MNRETVFLERPVGSVLLRYISQLALSLVLQSIYGVTDLWVVGHFCGAASVSAVSSGTLVTSFLTALITGLTTGATVLIARAVGRQDACAAAGAVRAEVLLVGSLALAVSAMTAVFAGRIAALMQAPAPALGEMTAYIRICGAGFVFVAAYNVINSLFRSAGDAGRPLQFIAVACAVNLALDIGLVGALEMGAAGAALATVCAQAVSAALPLLRFLRRGLPVRLVRPAGPAWPAVRRILAMGGPLVLNDVLTSLSFLAVTSRINALGLVASSSFGIAERMFTFLVLVPTAFLNGLASVVAQNMGAGCADRARRALWISCGLSLCFGAAAFALTRWGGALLASLFENDAAVVAAAAEYLHAGAFEYLFVSVSYCFQGYYNGCGKTRFVMFAALVCALGVRMPLTFWAAGLAQPSMGLMGAVVSAAAGANLALVAAYDLCGRMRSRRVDRR